ncbi:hypothetical protein VTN49DRAFT_6668 [Thermomyces lanuginosus]|uniref:uncharacterized protein n=1 Tax=Thermomyces lanuginosus TaxID=5541 RepID=UPI0037428790
MPIAEKQDGAEDALDCARARQCSCKKACTKHASRESSISARQSPTYQLDNDVDSSPIRPINMMDETSGSEADCERESNSPGPGHDSDNFSTGKYMRFNRRWGISRYFPSPNASIPVKHTRRQFSPSEDEGSKEMLDTNGSSENHKPEKDPPSKRKHQEDAEEPGIRPRKRAKKQQTQRSQRRNAK